jgi:hypothetical protein
MKRIGFLAFLVLLSPLIYSQSIIKRINVDPVVIQKDEKFKLWIEISKTGIDSIVVQVPNSPLYLNNYPINQLTLYDNGKNGDKVSNDRIFTVGGLSVVANFIDIWREWLFIKEAKLHRSIGDTTFLFQSAIGPQIMIVDTNIVEIPKILMSNDSLQFTTHVINVVNPTEIDSYNSVPDWIYANPFNTDVIMIGFAYPTPGAPSAWCEGTVIRFFHSYYGELGLFIHEFLHRYAVFLNASLDLSYSAHWSAVKFPCSGFGSGLQRTDFEKDETRDSIYLGWNNSSYTNKYNSLELYLMGAIGIDDVEFPVQTLKNPQYIGYEGSNIVFKSSGFRYVTKSEFLSTTGPQNPDYTVSKKEFSSSLILFSQKLLTPIELSYAHHLMKLNELQDTGKIEMINEYNSSYNFYGASNGKLKLITKLETIGFTPSPIQIVEPINNTSSILTPVSVKWTPSTFAAYYKLEISTNETFSALVIDTSITGTQTFLNNLKPHTKYFARVRGENNNLGQWSTTVSFTTLNIKPNAFTFIKPENNSIISYLNKKLIIEYTPYSAVDLDGDSLTAILHLYGTKLDTCIKIKGNIGSVSIDSSVFQPNSPYTLKGVVTDSYDTINAINEIKFTTPAIVGIFDNAFVNTIKIYPNPVQNTLTIKLDLQQPNKLIINIINISGQVIMEQRITMTNNAEENNLNIQSLASGLYFLNIQSEGSGTGKWTKTLRFTKQ